VILVSVSEAFGLVTVIVCVAMVPRVIVVEGENVSVMLGGKSTANAGLANPAIMSTAVTCAKNAQLNIRLIRDLRSRLRRLAELPACRPNPNI
jgi:hypothetical protein